MSKVIYRVYDIYCTGDSMLYSESKQVADYFCSKLNKKDSPISYRYRVEDIFLNEPYWKEDLDCMPEHE